MLRRTSLALALLLSALCPASFAQQAPETISIDAKAPTTPLPHFWEQMFGSGRANLSMRQGYRDDLRKVQAVTGFSYVRFHAIFQDENGVYDEDAQGNPIYNWSYVDQIYDGLLANGVKPFVEISFMPKKLAARLDYHAFWYKQIVSPPADYAKWDALVTAFAQHLIERYGIGEVSQWYFEVWNEPNIDFWTGRPAQQTYFELYDHTARALKAVNAKIRVGGPATAQARMPRRTMSRWTSSPRMSMATTRPRTSSATIARFLRTRWSAPRSRRCMSRSRTRRSPISRSSGASSTRRMRTSSPSPIPSTWARGWRTPSGSATARWT
jgi:beta-xylosidase